jgi:hypothetical protein
MLEKGVLAYRHACSGEKGYHKSKPAHTKHVSIR